VRLEFIQNTPKSKIELLTPYPRVFTANLRTLLPYYDWPCGSGLTNDHAKVTPEDSDAIGGIL
jgi:hypothetical protein